MTEQEFHNQRKAFAIFNDTLNWCPYGLSHHQWLVEQNIFCETVFNNLVRGYMDKTGIYFYKGNFETNEYVEDIAKSYMSSIDEHLPCFCGVQIGEIGIRWKPIKQVR